jgi:uncharacterized phage protein gp47/JayE
MPLTSEGYIAERSADFLTRIQQAVEAELTARGITPEIDWTSDTVYGILAAVVSVELGSLSEALQQVYDSRDINNAQGAQLDALGTLVGVSRNRATASTASVTLAGTALTFIPVGSLVQGGGEDGLARWATVADVTLTGGSDAVQVECTETGSTDALSGEIDTIVTLISGWNTVTNAADATPGQDEETDADYRARIVGALQVRAASSTAALRSRLRDLDYIEAAIVLENDTDVSATILGVSVDPHAVAVVLYPDALTPAQLQEVGSIIYDTLPMGIPTSPASGADETVTIDGFDGLVKTITWDYASEVNVTAEVEVTLASGYELGDVSAGVQEAVAAHFEALQVGESSYLLKIAQRIADVEGVVGATIEQAISPGSPAAVNLIATAVQKFVLLGTAAVTEAP